MKVDKHEWTVLIAMALTACANEARRPAGWSEATHGLRAVPDYELLFDADVVHSLEITISTSDYAAMQENLTSLLADTPLGPGGAGAGFPGMTTGDGGAAPPFPGGGLPAPNDGAPDGGAGFGPRPSGALDLLGEEPMYVPTETRHDGGVWTRVGMRYKGNSSLASSGGRGKLPFRLDFDEYEDAFPEIENQRFYGFSELTFSSNWNDDSQLRECFATELLRDRGVPAARCAFYRIFVDVGDGPQYWGLYSMIEDPSDAMIDSQLGGGDGNLYKPDGPAADWSTFDRETFAKKTNENDADWSDVEKAFAALHADRSEPSAWKRNLELTFDVDRFLGWLAINTAMVNWDSYGGLAHNYYLYGQPSLSGKLQWIPWDHNLSMQGGGFGQRRPGAATPAQNPKAELFHEAVGSAWPLISILLSDPLYAQTYREKLEGTIQGLFDAEPAAERLHALHDLIEPYVIGTSAEATTHTTISSAAAFRESVDGPSGLIAHLAARRERVRQALAQP
jgi:hypothetical protein